MHKSTGTDGDTALVVMARHPIPGRVKTRLAQALGAAGSCELYTAFLHDIEARWGGGRRNLIWMYEPADADFAAVVAAGSICLPQHGDGLAARMANAFQRLLQPRGSYRSVIMIGADVPHLPDDYLTQAERRLSEADVVIVPTTDGGYCLIAMDRPHDLFRGIEMGTDRVLLETLARADSLNLRVDRLPMWFDIDELADLDRLEQGIEDGSIVLPAVACALRSTRFGRRIE